MKKIFLTMVLIAYSLLSFAQKETFDLISYSAPANWKKEITENSTCYIIINNKTSNWCRVNILKSTTSKGDIDQDFESEWQDLVVKNYKPTSAPHLNETLENDGWKIITGGAKFVFENRDAMVIQTTASGYNRCVSIIAITNSKDYIKDIDTLLASIDLIKPETNTVETPVVNNNENSIVGTWVMNSNTQSAYAINNGLQVHITRQYSFNKNGTYNFYIKTFTHQSNQLLFTKENGTYQVNSNTLTINPQKSVIEAYSKKDGTDKWGNLLSSQKRTLEKTTYQFTKHYFSGIQEWSFVLQADKVTGRDGAYNGGSAFDKAWIYSPTASNKPAIELPGN